MRSSGWPDPRNVGRLLLLCFVAVGVPLSVIPSRVGAATRAAITWVDQPVTFTAGGLAVDATYRHPISGPSVPGVLLIAGSGPTDRNGNSPLETGTVGTLQTLADWLSADGVATLRYDKLGSGTTGLGLFALDPDTISITPYEQEAAAALRFLAAQKGVERSRLGVVGHSEGALFALLLATGHSGSVPSIHALGLLEPLSERYLTVISQQVQAQVAGQKSSGEISAAIAAQVDATLARAVAQLRAHGTVQAGLPYGLASLLSPSTATFLSGADRFDPATLAAHLHHGTPVLVSCSNADTQVTCAEVAHLEHGLAASHASVDAVTLHGVDHVLKVDPSGSAAGYTEPLPFSPQLQSALAAFVKKNL